MACPRRLKRPQVKNKVAKNIIKEIFLFLILSCFALIAIADGCACIGEGKMAGLGGGIDEIAPHIRLRSKVSFSLREVIKLKRTSPRLSKTHQGQFDKLL